MKTKKKATRRLPANDIDLGKNTLLPDIDNVQVHSKSEKQRECHTLPGNYECGERNSMMMCETFGPVFSHTGTESSMAIPDNSHYYVTSGCTMEGVQIMDTPALDMQRPCYTPAASSLDKGKRKICDVYNDRQLLCPEDLLTIDGGCKPVMPDDPLHDAQCIMTLQGNDNSSNASHNTSSIILPSNDLNMCNTTEHRHTQAAANASVLGNHLRSAGQSTQHAHARAHSDVGNIMRGGQGVCSSAVLQDGCSSSTETHQSRSAISPPNNASLGTSNRRRTAQVTMRESSAIRQRRPTLHNRGRTPRHGMVHQILTYIWANVTGFAIIATRAFGMVKRLLCLAGGAQNIINVVAGVKLSLRTTKSGQGLRADIVENLIEILDEHNELVQLLRTARDKMMEADIPEFKVRLFGVVGSNQHELPTGDSIGAIVFEGGPDVETEFDVVIEQHDRQLKSTSSIVPSSSSKGKEIVAQSEEASLAALKETDHGKVIHVKVYRKWIPTNKQGKPVVFCVMLIDKQDERRRS
ncbi:hypothetical protein CTI12_AA126660 [Artemisia annua]|uniref:Uncharacterized protein n=1 Tax=Artemisia annua TaxID=35608 RepID=A0A2U1PQ24_ARTAN|nr:hypothetical protein CTI12_AA126660 [Artemisia annua]